MSKLKRLRSRIALRRSPFFAEMIDRAQHLVEQIIQQEGTLQISRWLASRHPEPPCRRGNHRPVLADPLYFFYNPAHTCSLADRDGWPGIEGVNLANGYQIRSYATPKPEAPFRYP